MIISIIYRSLSIEPMRLNCAIWFISEKSLIIHNYIFIVCATVNYCVHIITQNNVFFPLSTVTHCRVNSSMNMNKVYITLQTLRFKMKSILNFVEEHIIRTCVHAFQRLWQLLVHVHKSINVCHSRVCHCLQ